MCTKCYKGYSLTSTGLCIYACLSTAKSTTDPTLTDHCFVCEPGFKLTADKSTCLQGCIEQALKSNVCQKCNHG